jgi:hypothetical protein
MLPCNSISLRWLVDANGALITSLPTAIVFCMLRGALGSVTFVQGSPLHSSIVPCPPSKSDGSIVNFSTVGPGVFSSTVRNTVLTAVCTITSSFFSQSTANGPKKAPFHLSQSNARLYILLTSYDVAHAVVPGVADICRCHSSGCGISVPNYGFLLGGGWGPLPPPLFISCTTPLLITSHTASENVSKILSRLTWPCWKMYALPYPQRPSTQFQQIELRSCGFV